MTATQWPCLCWLLNKCRGCFRKWFTCFLWLMRTKNASKMTKPTPFWSQTSCFRVKPTLLWMRCRHIAVSPISQTDNVPPRYSAELLCASNTWEQTQTETHSCTKPNIRDILCVPLYWKRYCHIYYTQGEILYTWISKSITYMKQYNLDVCTYSKYLHDEFLNGLKYCDC